MEEAYDDVETEGDDNQHRAFFIFLQFPILTEPLCLGIAEMEKQMEAMRGTISVPKQQRKGKQPKKAARRPPTPTAPSSSKPAKAVAFFLKEGDRYEEFWQEYSLEMMSLPVQGYPNS